MRAYLDWNATTPPSAEVLEAMRDAASRAWGNPASVHADGRAARAVVEDARAAVAALADADPRDVLFTSGGTEANNIALRSAFADAANPGAIVLSPLEHPSIGRVAEALAREGKATVRRLRVRPDGAIDLDSLDRALAEGDVALVCVMAVNHETGVVQPVAEVAERARRAGARVHVDAVQAWGKVDAASAGASVADSVTIAAHKMRGPKGIGALVTRPGAKLAPVLLGGSQERGLRPGTVDAVLAAGFGAAARHAATSHVHFARVAALRDRLEAALVALGGRRAGDPARRAPHVSSLMWPGWVGAELVAALDLEGVSVSGGAACSAGTVEPSPVLFAMLGEPAAGTEEWAAATSGVRVSMGEGTTDADVDLAIAAFRRVLARASRGGSSW